MSCVSVIQTRQMAIHSVTLVFTHLVLGSRNLLGTQSYPHQKKMHSFCIYICPVFYILLWKFTPYVWLTCKSYCALSNYAIAELELAAIKVCTLSLVHVDYGERAARLS